MMTRRAFSPGKDYEAMRRVRRQFAKSRDKALRALRAGDTTGDLLADASALAQLARERAAARKRRF